VSTSRSLTRARWLVLPACAAVVLLGLASTAASASQVRALQTPPTVTQQQQLGSGGSASGARTAKPQDEFFCDYEPTITLDKIYSAKHDLLEVVVVYEDTPLCSGVVAILITEDAKVVTPDTGTHTLVDHSCSECTELQSLGGYHCTAGLGCAGEWTFEIEVRFVLAPGYDFGAETPNCKPSGPTNNILTCHSTPKASVAAHD
jgi:hypothetical protein